MKQLSARQQRYNAEIDPEGVQKGAQIIGTWNDAMGAAPMSSPSESTQTNYDNDNDGFQFNLGGDEDDFLGRISEDFPATNLNPERYAVSNDPKETTVGLSGGAMQAGQAGPAEVSQINALAKSGDEMASQFKNPLSEFKTPGETANPLNDFDVDPASAMQSTLDRNKNAFGGANKQQPTSDTMNANNLRPDNTVKGMGFLGAIPRLDNPKDSSTELSIGVDWGTGEKLIPTMVPTLDDNELKYLLSTTADKLNVNPDLNKSITRKAVEFAKQRESQGLPFFAQEDEVPKEARKIKKTVPEAPTLGDSITKFRNWERNAQRTIRQLDKSSPGEAQLATRAYNEQLGDFYADNFNGLDEDEINYLMKNPSKADRYIGYKEDFGPEEASWLSKINPSYADGVVRVFKDGKLPDGTSVVAESLEQSKMIYDNAIRQGMKPTPEENSAKRVQDRQVAMKNFFEIRNAANENPEDKTLQATYQLSLSDMKSVYGDEWDRVKFGLNQQDFGNALKFQGQKVDLKGKPVEGLNAKTADQSRLEMIQSGLIPSIKILSKDGKLKVDESELNKIPDGAYFAGIDENNAVGEFRKENGKPVALSKPAPSNEETPLDARIKEIEAKEAVANAGSNKKRIQEIDREISALSAPITQRRESSFSPMGYSAPVSSRALNKNELIRNRNRILELKKLKASLQK
jgi:hypothetical protein